MMESDDDLTTRILNSLSALPASEQTEAIMAVVSTAMKSMSMYRILDIRAEIAAELNSATPLVGAALELIDGQIALRDIGGDEEWR